MMKKISFVISVSSLALLVGCAKSGGSKESSAVPPGAVLVQPSDISTCDLDLGKYRCRIDGQNAQGQSGRFDASFEISESRRGRQTVNFEGFPYRVDGQVHQETNRHGIQLQYNVRCAGKAAEIHVRSTNTAWSLRVDLQTQGRRQAQARIYLTDKNGAVTQGSGSCHASSSREDRRDDRDRRDHHDRDRGPGRR